MQAMQAMQAMQVMVMQAMQFAIVKKPRELIGPTRGEEEGGSWARPDTGYLGPRCSRGTETAGSSVQRRRQGIVFAGLTRTAEES